MNLEETKEIIENEIEAETLTRDVRSQIKTYIDQKQNLREGFKETFQPLIETQKAVKTSIDTQQNKLIEQLQENQLALTEGLDKNRLAITSGFDTMDEVRRSDLKELPGIEAIQHPETKETEKSFEEPGYWISNNDLKLLLGGVKSDFTPEDEDLNKISKEYYDEILLQNKLNTNKYVIEINPIDPEKIILKVIEKDYGEKPEKGVVTFDDSDLDEGFINTRADKVLKELKLPLPSTLKNRKLEDIQLFQNNAEIMTRRSGV